VSKTFDFLHTLQAFLDAADKPTLLCQFRQGKLVRE